MRLVDELGARVRELLGMRPSGRVRRPAPPPPVRLALAGAVPGALVRVVPGLLVLVLTALVGGGPPAWWVAALAAGVAVARPDWPAPSLFLLLVGTWVLLGPDLTAPVEAASGGTARLVALVACAHLALRAASLAQHVSWRTLVEVPVLCRALRSVLAVQLVVQSLLLGTVWLRANLGRLTTLGDWARLLAVGAVVALVVAAVPRHWYVAGSPRRSV